MNTFKMQCINYLLVRGWLQDVDGHDWLFTSDGINFTSCTTIGEALDFQLEWDDEAGI